MLGRPTKDADIVCVGDGIPLAHKVAERFKPKPSVSFLKLMALRKLKLDDFEIEFVGARKESYGTTAATRKWCPVHWKMTRTGGILPSMPWQSA